MGKKAKLLREAQPPLHGIMFALVRHAFSGKNVMHLWFHDFSIILQTANVRWVGRFRNRGRNLLFLQWNDRGGFPLRLHCISLTMWIGLIQKRQNTGSLDWGEAAFDNKRENFIRTSILCMTALKNLAVERTVSWVLMWDRGGWLTRIRGQKKKRMLNTSALSMGLSGLCESVMISFGDK